MVRGFVFTPVLTSDYPSCLHLLMKYPPVSDVEYFIEKALYLRDPNVRPYITVDIFRYSLSRRFSDGSIVSLLLDC